MGLHEAVLKMESGRSKKESEVCRRLRWVQEVRERRPCPGGCWGWGSSERGASRVQDLLRQKSWWCGDRTPEEERGRHHLQTQADSGREVRAALSEEEHSVLMTDRRRESVDTQDDTVIS